MFDGLGQEGLGNATDVSGSCPVPVHHLAWACPGACDSRDATPTLVCCPCSLLEALQSDTNRVASKPAYKELAGKGTEEEQVGLRGGGALVQEGTVALVGLGGHRQGAW